MGRSRVRVPGPAVECLNAANIESIELGYAVREMQHEMSKVGQQWTAVQHLSGRARAAYVCDLIIWFDARFPAVHRPSNSGLCITVTLSSSQLTSNPDISE